MKNSMFKVTVGLFAAAVVAGGALAQQPEDLVVTVSASRVVTTDTGQRSAIGAPIKGLSLSYKVNYSDLNLATPAGAAELEKRVNGASKAACAELGRLYPDSTPRDAECTKATVKAAMVEVHAAVAAAGKAPKK